MEPVPDPIYNHPLKAGATRTPSVVVVVAVNYVIIVAIGHGLLKKFWPYGSRLRSTHCREFLYMK